MKSLNKIEKSVNQDTRILVWKAVLNWTWRIDIYFIDFIMLHKTE